MKIIIHPKARKALIAILIISLLITVFLYLRPWLFPQTEKSESALTPDAQAAMDAVTAFYTLDYTTAPELWISNICMLATEKGCDAIRFFYAPTVKTLVQNSRIQTSCTVHPIKLVVDGGDIRIWKVSVTLDHPWVGLEAPTQEIYVEVEKVNVSWLMNRILFNQEAKRFTAPVH